MEEGAEIAMPCILEREAVQKLSVRPDRREGIEHANGTRMIVEHLTEIGFAQPRVLVRAHLETEFRGHDRRSPEPCPAPARLATMS